MKTEPDISHLTESESLFRLFVETMDYAVIILSPAGKLMIWNLGAEQMFEYSLKECQDKHISFCYPNADKKSNLVTRQLTDSIRNGKAENETQLMRKDGSLFFANIIYTPLHSKQGILKGFGATVRDVRAQKQLADENTMVEQRATQQALELESLNRELNAFSYSVSHDLRSPLRAINGFSRMMLQDYKTILDSEGNRMLNTIVENAETMGKLIDGLLEFSRLSRLDVLDMKIDMNAIVLKCIADLKIVWPQSHCSIATADFPSCNADPVMMKRTWMNLIENAMKFSSKKEQPELKIGYKEDEKFFTYFITDNGIGFDMRYTSKLFSIFQKLHSDDDFPGTGLGLALVNRIIAKHGGKLWAYGELNKGATFYFTVPK